MESKKKLKRLGKRLHYVQKSAIIDYRLLK